MEENPLIHRLLVYLSSPVDFPRMHHISIEKVIKGWREGLQLMKEGAKWELYIPPKLAYGKSRRPQSIPPNSVLIFEVELIKVK